MKQFYKSGSYFELGGHFEFNYDMNYEQESNLVNFKAQFYIQADIS